MITVAKLDERIERCLAILADNPHSQVFAALAEAYRRRGEFGRAFAVCKGGLKHHPRYAPAHVVMAKLYLHQKMLPEAMASVKKAIDIDGRTRGTDMLEAELSIEAGDLAAAATVIDRLRRTERRNPVVGELVDRLKRLRKQTHARTDSAVSDSATRTSVETAQHDDTVTRVMPSSPAPNEPLSWKTWSERLCALNGVGSAFAWDESSQIVYPVEAATTGDCEATSVLDMFRNVESELNGGTKDPLNELRVETDTCQLWCGRIGRVVIGVVGDARMSYGEVRRMAIDWYAQIGDDQTLNEMQSAGNQES